MKTLAILLFGCASLCASAQLENASGHELAGNLLSYPYLDQEPPQQTEAPAGYVPFHIEHYGRHGSRWLLGHEDYAAPVKNLEKAEKAGKLTPLGEKTIAALRGILEESKGRLGELSDKGALQHQGIGRRMAQNFPEVFTPEADLTAKSTVVIRCIISMMNAIEGINSVVPGLHFDKDASQADMWFMNFNDRPAWLIKDSVTQIVLPPYQDSVMVTDTYLSRLVTDEQFAKDSVAPGMLPRLYWVLGNAQSHSTQPWLFEDVFSREELIENWKNGNAGWFLHGGNSRMTEGRMPYVQRNLLGRIIERTDSAINSKEPSANLRFGHDGILVSIITLMELGGYGNEIPSLEALDQSDWRDYEIIPMAGNLQLVFYRLENGSTNPDEVLVKALINEREVTMPGTPVEGPYYRWSELKDYYQKKLATFNHQQAN